MADYKTFLVIFGGLLSIITSIFYIRSILKKQTIPHMYSQIIWNITITIGLLGQVYDHSGIGTIILFIIDLGVFSVLLLSFKYGLKDPTKLDKIFLALALVSVIPRLFTNNPVYSVIFVTFIDALAYFPLLNKIRRYPNSEALLPRVIGNISSFAGIMGLNHISILSSLYLIVSFTMNLIVIMFIIFLNRNKKGKNKKNLIYNRLFI